jgi:hypothetical protein
MSLFRVIRPPIESVSSFAALHDVTEKANRKRNQGLRLADREI